MLFVNLGMSETPDIRLVIKISNSKPLELLDLTKSFLSIANQFNSYVAINGHTKEDREAKLYVKEIKAGSVILELVEFASKSAIPFAENVSTIVGFAGHLKTAYNFFLGKQKEPPVQYTQTDYKDLSQILNPVANDNAAQFNISTTINGDLNVYLNLDSNEANAAQHIIDKNSKLLKAPENDGSVKSKVLLTLFQTRSDTKAKTGNKGVIEDISDKPLNLVFDNESLNHEMLHSDFNPNEKIFVGDVLIQNAGGKPNAYKIIKLHDTFEKESN